MTPRATIEIDPHSGFCFGVTTAIKKAETELQQTDQLYCLGEIVHNNDEVKRLGNKGLRTITHGDLHQLHNAKVLLRAHGEPPATYRIARRNNIEIVDATCPVVLALQRRIKQAYAESSDGRQIVIFGKRGHAEVNGLVGQTDGNAIVVESDAEIDSLDYSRPIMLYSQTTKSPDGLRRMIDAISRRMAPGVRFEYFDTICRQVSNRVELLREFACRHDVVLFVSSAQSSNGKVLFDQCLSANNRSYFVSNADDVRPDMLSDASTIGVCGATSTPRWLMEQVRDQAAKIVSQNG